MNKKIKPMVSLNVNPCKMCMPMGVVTAFYGIKKGISILHGSQGCSTYIRRHMATHYNEPVDIASSSLTEHGTVYGGEENLLLGLKNLIQLYHPEVIGVATTCLAETIGEDISRIIGKFYEENREYQDITIIPVPSPGYGGTQYEGYMRALFQIVNSVKQDPTPNGKINVITSMISPADTRYLKVVFELFGLEMILLPDLSENLDGVYQRTYQRLPSAGTDIKEIKTMAGARFTIELGTAYEGASIGAYLEENYQVPYRRMNLPVGLRDTDAFYDLLAELALNREVKLPKKITRSRGRYLDAMIDSHKYNGEARTVIYGEPDFVISTARLCMENGVMPLLIATGSKNTKLQTLLQEEVKVLADRYFIEDFKILDDIDFKEIEHYAKELDANLMIGNSDGRRIEEELNLPLIRRGFPIHDRVGGQRLRMLGYEGSLTLLDEIANAVMSKKERNFRKDLYQEYYKEESKETQEVRSNVSEKENVKDNVKASEEVSEKASDKFKDNENETVDIETNDKIENSLESSIEQKTKTHPCYSCGTGGNYARMHLPIAPKCNIQCNYCVRKYDCPNESRPGVTTKVLTPLEAVEKFKYVKNKIPNLTVVGIAGPGDALANFEETKEALEMIRKEDPNITFCLSTNGLMLPTYASQLVELGVSHLTVTMNAVDPKIGGQIYKHIDYMGNRYYGESAGAILLANQLAGLKIMVAQGIICKVNIVSLKGINDHHIPEVVAKVKEIGVYITNIMPMISVAGSAFEHLEALNHKELTALRNECGKILKQMYHCKQCRADAIGTLEEDVSIEFNQCHSSCKETDPQKLTEIAKKVTKTYRFAVATKSGMLVDQHFGHATEFYIYECKNEVAVFKERRVVEQYCNGSELCEDTEDKIVKLIHTIKDCDGVITMRIGDAPKQKLKEQKIEILTTYDRIEAAVVNFSKQLIRE
jgi:nitrogenase cofactor biosynthesis protein NifB